MSMVDDLKVSRMLLARKRGKMYVSWLAYMLANNTMVSTPVFIIGMHSVKFLFVRKPKLKPKQHYHAFRKMKWVHL